MPLARVAYEMVWTTLFFDLKAYLLDTPCFTWIEAFDATEDGHGAYLACEAHYNGHELTKHMALAKMELDHLYYNLSRVHHLSTIVAS
jgi:hypothetical protein